MVDDLSRRVLRHLRQTKLFDPPGRALLAISGGPDSLALLELMVAVAGDLGLELAIAHVDHGISDEARAMAPEVTRLAQQYSLQCHVGKLDLGPGTTETEAREARYRILREIQNHIGARYLVTAHHADDQVETVLYRFLRGSGVYGLSGIPSRGPDGLVRPLLPFTRHELWQWLKQARANAAAASTKVFQDPANADPRHDRSWIRSEILPRLRERFGPDLDANLLDTARDAARNRLSWAELLHTLPDLDFKAGHGHVEVARAPLQRYDKVLSEGLLRALAREVGCVVGPRRAELLDAFARGSSSGRRMELGSGWEAELAFERLRIVPAKQNERAGSDSEPAVWGESNSGCVRWNGWEFTWKQSKTGEIRRGSFSTWVTPGSGEVRLPRVGERLVPLGGVGRRKVRRLLMEARVPARERHAYPVVVRGSNVIWIPGICRSAGSVPRTGEMAVRLDARTTDRD
jgi:tRNA(Ile)-lysidine synthase